jgi:hypothetical protein
MAISKPSMRPRHCGSDCQETSNNFVEVTARRGAIDLSVVYDAPTKFAYESSDKSTAYTDFKTAMSPTPLFEVIAKRPADLSVVYDAQQSLRMNQR